MTAPVSAQQLFFLCLSLRFHAVMACVNSCLSFAGESVAIPGDFVAALGALAGRCNFGPAVGAVNEIRRRLEDESTVPAQPPVLLHGDIRPGNMLDSAAGTEVSTGDSGQPRRVVAWDWEHAVIADPRIELAWVASWAADPEAVWEAYGARVAEADGASAILSLPFAAFPRC